MASARLDDIQSASLADFQAECAARHRELPALQAAGQEATRELEEVTKKLAAIESKLAGALHPRLVQERRDRVDIAENIVDGLKKQIDGLRIDLTMDLNGEISSAIVDVVEAFNAMASSEMTWDVTEVRDGGAGFVRQPVKLDNTGLFVFKTNQPSCHFGNANSGDLYLYPGFLAIVDGSKLALLDLSEVDIAVSSTQFVETDRVPLDAKQVGKQWLRTNADGTPDRESKSNRELPLVEYGILDIRSPHGINERYMVSDVEATTVFGAAMDLLTQALVS